jgi:hypothetical protein
MYRNKKFIAYDNLFLQDYFAVFVRFIIFISFFFYLKFIKIGILKCTHKKLIEISKASKD